jgi:HD-GYP domain-containing protein (c-di-GMP phosphodiesterase class II)
MTQLDTSKTRLAELTISLSLATDLGMGQPMEQAINTCLLSVKAAHELGLTGADLSDVYFLAQLRFVGCTSDAHESAAAAGGDEIALRAGLATVLMGEPPELLGYMLHSYADNQHGLTRLRLVAGAILDGTRGPKRSIAEHCEVAQMLVTRLGIRREVGLYVGDVFERWDGKGLPGRLAGELIPLPARIVALARDVEIFHRAGGWSLTSDVLTRRRGKAYDPALVDLYLELAPGWLAGIAEGSGWSSVLAAEPEPFIEVEDTRLDGVLPALADFVDLKSPYMVGHSTEVAELAATTARAMGLSDMEIRDTRRAGLVHDLGRVGIPNGIWDKPKPLSTPEWERVRLHPYMTERILSYSTALRPLAGLAGAHHECLDGSGYHKGSSAAGLPRVARILAAADAYQAMTQPRPYRPPLDREARERSLLARVAAGQLDRDAVQALLTIAGHTARPVRQGWPAGLTEREVEVLRLISQGYSKNIVARQLSISVKTVARHIENIYGKIGVSSRAAAALFAMEHQLIQR